MLKIVFQAALLAAALPVPVLAQGKLPDIRVVYSDLDLSDPAGVRTLDRRLSAAVNAACPSDNGVREMSQLREIALCRAEKRAEVAPLRQTVLAEAAQKRSELALAH